MMLFSVLSASHLIEAEHESVSMSENMDVWHCGCLYPATEHS